MKHTLGPWNITPKIGLNSIRQIAPGICSLVIDSQETEANARLIAAAPELLEALKGFFEQDIPCPFKQFDGRLKDFAEWYKRAKDAVAKAEGREP